MKKLFENIYLALAVARKDIGEALKYKSSRVNILILFGMLLFFYWGSTIRPYDKEIQVVYIDKGSSSLAGSAALVGDATYRIDDQVSNLEEMSVQLKSRELGIVIPADFDERLETTGQITIQGYIDWVHRSKAAELAAKYSQDLSTLIGKQVTVEIGPQNALQPGPDTYNGTVVAIFVYLVVFMALTTVPYLMIIEKQTKTMDALLVSPAGPGVLVLGKALAGAFYVSITAAIFFVVYAAYFTNWGLAVFAALLICAFAVGLALLVGSLAKNPLQVQVWLLPIILLVIIPAFFAGESFLPAALAAIFSYIPTTAMSEILRFSLSSGVMASRIWLDVSISLAGIALVYAAVVAILRRSDR